MSNGIAHNSSYYEQNSLEPMLSNNMLSAPVLSCCCHIIDRIAYVAG